MTAWAAQDYERAEHTRPGDYRSPDHQDADRPTASKADLDREYHHGAEQGSRDVTRDAAEGRQADAREARHMERSGPAPDRGQHTPAEQRWHDGYRAGGHSAGDLLRELERGDFEVGA